MVGRNAKMKTGKRILVIIIWILLWQAVSSFVSLPLLLPNPLETSKAMAVLLTKMTFWQSLGKSLLRVLTGFVLAAILGTIFAVLCSKWTWFDQFFSPIKSLIRSTPISSFIILVLLWISVDIVPVFIAFLTVMPIIWQSVQQGIDETSPLLLEMGVVYSFSPGKANRYIYLPSILPYFYTASATGMGFAWKACIAAEVIAKPLFSVGKNLQDAKVYLQTDELFAWTFTVILLSLSLEAILKRLMNKGAIKQTRKKNAAA